MTLSNAIIDIFILIIIMFVIFKALEDRRKFDYNIFYTIRCPKCGDTYEVEDCNLHGEGIIPVNCLKCGYLYKQKNHIISARFEEIKLGENHEDNN